MTRTLFLLRHAKSDWNSGAASDFDRPLSQRGLHDAQALGEWLKQHPIQPERIISSPALRAKQTIERVCRYAQMDLSLIQWNANIYEASLDTLIAVVSGVPTDARRVLIVGHNPGLEHLLSFLCADIPLTDDGKLLTTANLAELSTDSPWNQLTPHCCDSVRVTRPKQLKETN